MSKLVEKITEKISTIAKKFKIKRDVIVEKTRDSNHGYFSSNIAMISSKDLKTNPMELGQKFVDQLSKDEYFDKVEIIKPGFLNFTVADKHIQEILTDVFKMGEKYGSSKSRNFKINLELVSANPTGYLHVGHARNGAIGDSCARILKFSGYDVYTEYYTNDAGNQINIAAVTLFYHYKKLLNLEISKPEEMYGGDMYIEVAQYFVDEYKDKFKDLDIINNKISDEKVHNLFKEKSVTFFMKEIKQQLIDFGVHIDYYSSEQKMYDDKEIEKMIEYYNKKGSTYESDGALWLRTTEFGDDKDRVLRKSNGDYTYITPDIACHKVRIERTNAKKYVNYWGGDHHGYIVRMRSGLALLGYDFDILDIDMIQMVRLTKDGQEYKMSKRKGTAVWLVDLLEMVGKDSVRYMLLSKTPSSHMDFDIDLAVQKNSSNPVYYAQYATARSKKVLLNAEKNGIKLEKDNFNLLTNKKEIELMIILDQFKKNVDYAAVSRLPNIVCDYVQTLSKAFHSYYSEVKIVNEEDVNLSSQRVGLVNAIRQVLVNAFNLLGIESKEEM